MIGYARVSTQDQNLELQREALTKAGCERIFEDRASGSRTDREGLARAIDMLRSGDTLVVWKLDRLGRSVKQLLDLVGELQQRGVQFKSLTDAIDTSTPSGRFFFHVMASLAEMERELIVERTRAGLEAARRLGRKGERRPKNLDLFRSLRTKRLALPPARSFLQRLPGQNQREAAAIVAYASITSGGAWTSSMSTPSPLTGNSSLPLGWMKQMS
nr:recombinase family protein [Tepidiphilus baoligensis]